MSGRTAVITGGNAGIGMETARALAGLGARVVITSRAAERGQAAVEELRRTTGNESVECVALDLASLASVRTCASTLLDLVPAIDVLDLNAGGLISRRRVTEDGFELQFQANHLGHFLLVTLLLERLVASAPARIILLSSWGHTQARRGLDFDDLQWERRPYRGSAVYGATKLMNIYLAVELARRLAERGARVTANAVHPGFVRSRFALDGDTRWMRAGLVVARPFARTPATGARGVVWLASSPAAASETGGYWIDCRRRAPSRAAQDPDAARRLWEVSADLAGV
jgi:NAD(P)-dependent dehydrogenase (short-subunit alcohol dehydrogenase family)